MMLDAGYWMLDTGYWESHSSIQHRFLGFIPNPVSLFKWVLVDFHLTTFANFLKYIKKYTLVQNRFYHRATENTEKTIFRAPQAGRL
jgi:hypothetical protein